MPASSVIGLLAGGAHRRRRALAFLLDIGANAGKLAVDHSAGGLRGFGKQGADVARARRGLLKRVVDTLREGLHQAFQFFAALLDAVDERFERIAPRGEHLVELALLTGKIARGTRQAFPVPRNRFSEAAGFFKRRPRRLVELIDLTGKMSEDRTEIVHAIAQRMLRRREIRTGRANRPLQRLAAVHEAIDHLGHARPQPLIRLDQGFNRCRGAGLYGGAQMRRRAVDCRRELVLLLSEVLHDGVGAALDRLRRGFPEAQYLLGNLFAESGQSIDEPHPARIEEFAQFARPDRQCGMQGLTAFPKRPFEVAKPIRQCDADFIDPLGEAVANLSGAPGEGRIEIFDRLRNRFADFLGAPGEHLPQVTCFAIQRRVDIAGMKTERLIDLLRPRGEFVGNGAAGFIKVPGETTARRLTTRSSN